MATPKNGRKIQTDFCCRKLLHKNGTEDANGFFAVVICDTKTGQKDSNTFVKASNKVE